MKVYQVFHDQVDRNGYRPFIHIPREAAQKYAPAAIDFTYAQAQIVVEKLRQQFDAAGYGPGDRVAIALDNRADFFLLFLALNALDISVVPLNSEQHSHELGHVIGHSDASLIVSLPEHRDKLAKALQTIEAAVPIVDYERTLAALPLTETSVMPLDDAALVYTSGSTGQPKGCLLSEDYFVHVGDWYRDLGGYCALEPECERLLTPLPTFHVNALVFSFMAMLSTGGCVVQLDRFHPSSWWGTVRNAKATVIHYLGVMPAMLLARPPESTDDFSGQIKFGFGAGVEPEHHAAFESRFGFPLTEGWAMTETGAAACIMANTDPRHVGTRCIGRVPAAIEYSILDAQGQKTRIDEPGELLVRSSGPDHQRAFFSGYYKDERATTEAWQGGWFHTGDVVRESADGYLFFVERKKNIIRRSGENIAISEIEATLLQHKAVDVCAAAPVRDSIRGEEVFACIVLCPDVMPSLDIALEIFNFCKGRLAYYKTPGYFAFIKEIPTTTTQKIKRGDMKVLAAELVTSDKTADFRHLKRRGNSKDRKTTSLGVSEGI